MHAVKLNVSVIKCGRCGKRYTNPLTHTCVVRMDRKTAPGPAKVKPKVQVKCGRCGHPLGNPLTHKCVTRTDFRKRKAAFEKSQAAPHKPAPAGNAHEYTDCHDPDCSRFQCRVYKEGLANGEVIGRQVGYSEGWAAGASAMSGR